MTAVSGQKAQTVHGQGQIERSLYWTERGSVFELKSSDKKLLETARRVFVAESPEASDIPTRSWTIERASQSEPETWNVSGSSEMSSMLPVRAKSRDVALLHVELDALEFLLNNSPDAITVHAALLSKNGRGIVIVGPSFAGKSTLAIALWRNGWSLMCDDMVFIDTALGIASPAPRRVSLRHGSRDLVGDLAWNEISETPSCIKTEKGLFFHPHEVPDIQKERTTSLSAIFFLARLDSTVGHAEVRAINPARGALSLLAYAFNARSQPFVEGLRWITPLLDKIPAYDLGRGDLQSMVNGIEATVG